MNEKFCCHICDRIPKNLYSVRLSLWEEDKFEVNKTLAFGSEEDKEKLQHFLANTPLWIK